MTTFGGLATLVEVTDTVGLQGEVQVVGLEEMVPVGVGGELAGFNCNNIGTDETLTLVVPLKYVPLTVILISAGVEKLAGTDI